MSPENMALLEKHLATTDKEFDAMRKFIVGDSGDLARIQMCRLSVGPRMARKGGNAKTAVADCAVHLLMNDVPGTGKTSRASVVAGIADNADAAGHIVKSAAMLTGTAAEKDFQRIQFNRDITPSRILGGYFFIGDRFVLLKGPIFARLILADEVNRALPQAQGALIEAMAEGQVTFAKLSSSGDVEGEETRLLPAPFQVIATQNPIEQEGVEELAEAWLDRFGMAFSMKRYTLDDLVEITKRNEEYGKFGIEPVSNLKDLSDRRAFIQAQVSVPDYVRVYAARLAMATHNPFSEDYGDERKRSVDLEKSFMENWKYIWKGTLVGGKYRLDQLIGEGSSPRGPIFLLNLARTAAFIAHKREGRDTLQVTPKDIKKIAPDVLGHRLWLTNQAKWAADEFGGRHILARKIVEHISQHVGW